MNTLGYRCTEDNGLSFELLVDGRPLGVLVGARDTAIPYWLIKDDLPSFPPDGAPKDRQIRIVTVCSCGDYGCGHTQCRVLHDQDTVVFRNFDSDASGKGSTREFCFVSANYDGVIAEIVTRAREHASTARSALSSLHS